MSLGLALAVVTAALIASGALAAGGRLELYLVNSGPQSAVYNDSSTVDGNCDQFTRATSLSTARGNEILSDSPGYAFEAPDHPLFSYTVPAGQGFTVKANANAVVLKLWTSSGDGSCRGQTGDQTIDWRVLCNGVCGSDVVLTGAAGQDKPGYQALQIPAGTRNTTLANDHAGPDSAVGVGAGDVITLELSADTWSVFHWNGPTAKVRARCRSCRTEASRATGPDPGRSTGPSGGGADARRVGDVAVPVLGDDVFEGRTSSSCGGFRRRSSSPSVTPNSRWRHVAWASAERLVASFGIRRAPGAAGP